MTHLSWTGTIANLSIEKILNKLGLVRGASADEPLGYRNATFTLAYKDSTGARVTTHGAFQIRIASGKYMYFTFFQQAFNTDLSAFTLISKNDDNIICAGSCTALFECDISDALHDRVALL